MSKEALDFAAIVCKGSEGQSVKHFLGHSSKAAGSVDETQHSINFVISTDEVDRDNEIVTVAAIAKAVKGSFAKNPVALAGHEHRLENGKPPAVGSWDVSTFKAFKNHSEMRLFFAVDTELGLEYWKLYSKGHMRAVSIGFRMEKWKDVQDAQHGRIRIVTQLELLEISPVAVGANASALSKSKQRKAEFVQDKKEAVLFEKYLAADGLDWDTLEKQAQEYADYMFDCGEGEEAEETDNNKNELLDLIGCKQVDNYCDFAALVSGV